MVRPPLVSPVDPSNPLPLHHQVEERVRAILKEKPYIDGHPLPDEILLSSQLGVSRGTLRLALGRLVTFGLLERQRGKGTRRAITPQATALSSWESFTREMERRGVVVDRFLTKATWVKATETVARHLNIPVNSKVLHLVRVRGYEKIPAVQFLSWFHPRLNLSPQSDFDSPLYEMISTTTNVTATYSIEEISAESAHGKVAQALSVDLNVPLLVRRRQVLDATRRPIEYAEVRYRTDRYTYTLEIERKRS